MDIINNRRSIRSFTNKAVEDEKIEKLLRAGMQAPSAANQQPWEFVVVKSDDLREKLGNTSPYATPAKKAPLNILVLGNKNIAKFPQIIDQDLSACVQNILLEVTYLNLGAVWLGVKPEEERMKSISEILNLPSHLEPFALLAIGYSDNKNTYIDRYDETRVHYESFK